MTTANDQIACPECGYGWNEFTHGFHYTHCSKVVHLSHEQITYQCPNCGQVDSHADECPSNPQRHEHDTPAAPERGEWRADSSGGWGYVWQGGACLAQCPEPSRAQQIVTEHNQHSTLIAQRERLLAAIRKFVNYYDGANTARLGNGQARRSLDEFKEVLTTVEQERKQR